MQINQKDDSILKNSPNNENISIMPKDSQNIKEKDDLQLKIEDLKTSIDESKKNDLDTNEENIKRKDTSNQIKEARDTFPFEKEEQFSDQVLPIFEDPGEFLTVEPIMNMKNVSEKISKIEVNEAQINISKGFLFNRKIVLFPIETKPQGWKVFRTFEDCILIDQTFHKLFPYLIMPYFNCNMKEREESYLNVQRNMLNVIVLI